MILVDLNVVLDVLQRRAPRYARSVAVIDRIVRGEIRGAVATHAVTTLHYLVAKSAGPAAARQAVDWLLAHFEVGQIGVDELRRARSLAFEDFEDAVVAAAAEQMRCSAIVTNNVRDFSNSPIPVIAPQELHIDSLHEEMASYRADRPTEPCDLQSAVRETAGLWQVGDGLEVQRRLRDEWEGR
jgi:predicted nucleic acid-binding protein